MTAITKPRNALLAAMTPEDTQRLAPLLHEASFDTGHLFSDPGDEIDTIVFPHTGMVSLLAVMLDGSAVETATVGNEGVVGAMAGLGLHITLTRAIVQTPLIAARIPALAFRRAVATSDTLRALIVRYNEALLAQVQMTAACNALHTLEARLSRWILQTRDRIDTDAIPLTQELLSEMLGVRRSSVSEVASKLQTANLITYSRGIINIVNRPGLERASCECYETIKSRTVAIMA